jgi:cbb3-type cytochrome c oxidase subunit II
MLNRLLRANGAHRRLEGWPLVFTLLTVGSILVGTVVEFAPIFLVRGSAVPVEGVEPWTPLELAGRDLYVREGCNNCHSQMVRPFRHEAERYGPHSTAAEVAYETPHLWGSKRTGPDLARLGGKYPHLWHVRHMENPRSTSPGSIMPTYEWLQEQETDYGPIPRRLAVLQTLGLPYTDAEIEGSIRAARAQAEQIGREIAEQGGPADLADREITALIAYLQRLGTMREADFEGPAEADREPHEQQEVIETMQGEQPGALPGALPPEPADALPDPTDDPANGNQP